MLPRSDDRETLMGYQGKAYVPYRSAEEYGQGQQNTQATLNRIIISSEEFEQNQEERCAILLCLDRSESMKGKAIEELNRAVDQFGEDLRENPSVAAKVDIGVVLFNEDIKAEGGTKISFAIDVALDMCERRKDLYKTNGTVDVVRLHKQFIVPTPRYKGRGRNENILRHRRSPRHVRAAQGSIQDERDRRTGSPITVPG